MKRDPIERNPVQRRLGARDALEDVAGQPPRLWIQPSPLQEPTNLRVIPMFVMMPVMVVLVVVGAVHDESRARKRPAPPLLEAHLQPVHAHFRDGVAHHLGGNASVHQRRHRHVARDPGRRVEMHMQSAQSMLHDGRTRLSMEASRPAPNPLSMLTTATPVAQELSMVSKAATPPNEAP